MQFYIVFAGANLGKQVCSFHDLILSFRYFADINSGHITEQFLKGKQIKCGLNYIKLVQGWPAWGLV